jgi:hypothetical protein
MNKQKLIVFTIALVLIGGTAVVLARLKANQKLGQPGVKTAPIAGSQNLQVVLPETVTGFRSEPVEISDIVVNTLPKDTSYGQRRYQAEDGFQTWVNVVLMGSDRTSLHKPQFCLEGAGWKINLTEMRTVTIEQPRHYELPVMKLTTTKQATVDGRLVTVRGIYVYWFVAENQYTAQHWERMWWMAKNLVQTGELQRWAYVSCFAMCRPGEEEMTYNRMVKFIAASVPEFQLVGASADEAQISSVAVAR